MKYLETYDEDYFEKGLRSGYKNYGHGLVFWFTSLLWAILIKILLHPKTLLDVGTAKGQFLLRFRHLGIEAFGVDHSEYAVSHTPSSVKKFIRQGNITALPYKDNSFGVVSTFDVLEHIPETEINEALKECQRVSKDYAFHKINTGVMEWKNPGPSHVLLRPAKWWIAKFKSLNIKIKYTFFVPFSWIIITAK